MLTSMLKARSTDTRPGFSWTPARQPADRHASRGESGTGVTALAGYGVGGAGNCGRSESHRREGTWRLEILNWQMPKWSWRTYRATFYSRNRRRNPMPASWAGYLATNFAVIDRGQSAYLRRPIRAKSGFTERCSHRPYGRSNW